MLRTIYIPWYIPWYILWYMGYVLWWYVASQVRARGQPPRKFHFFAKNLKIRVFFYVILTFLVFVGVFGLRNLSRIRDLVNTVLFRQGSVSKLARGEKL